PHQCRAPPAHVTLQEGGHQDTRPAEQHECGEHARKPSGPPLWQPFIPCRPEEARQHSKKATEEDEGELGQHEQPRTHHEQAVLTITLYGSQAGHLTARFRRAERAARGRRLEPLVGAHLMTNCLISASTSVPADHSGVVRELTIWTMNLSFRSHHSWWPSAARDSKPLNAPKVLQQ